MFSSSDFRAFTYNELQGTQYIEIASTPGNEKISVWGKNSLYFSDTVFSLVFSYPLHNSSEKYDLFGFCEFSVDEQANLVKELSKNGENIDRLGSYEDIINFSQRDGNEFQFEDIIPMDNQEISKIIKAMNDINVLMGRFVEESIRKGNILSVLGL